MPLKKILVAVAVLSVSCMIFSAVELFAVGSEGYENQVISGKALGMGNAFVAVADNPTAVFFNPAGLTQMQGLNLSLGASVLMPKTEYKSAAGDKAETKSETFAIPNIFAAYSLNDKVSLGLGVYSNFGLATEWKVGSDLQYLATKSELVSYNINPSVAYKVSDSLSVGAGVDYYMFTDVSLKKQLPVALLNVNLGGALALAADGQSELSGDGTGMGGNVGLMYKLSECHTLGLTYKSSAKVDIDGDMKLKGLSAESANVFGGADYSTPVKTKLNVPPRLLAGYAWKPAENILVAVDYQWTGWSVYDEINLKYNETDPFRLAVLNDGNPEPKRYKDSSSAGAGVQYALNDSLRLRGGFFYFETPVTHKYFSPSIPGLTRNCVTLGAGYDIGAATLDLGYGYYIGREREIKSGGLADGKYSGSSHLLALNYSYKF